MSKVVVVVFCTVVVASLADGSPAGEKLNPAQLAMKENCEIQLHNMTHALTEITTKLQPLLVDPENDPIAVKLGTDIDQTLRFMEHLQTLDGSMSARKEFKKAMDLCRDLVLENLGTVAWVSFFVDKNEPLVSYQTD